MLKASTPIEVIEFAKVTLLKAEQFRKVLSGIVVVPSANATVFKLWQSLNMPVPVDSGFNAPKIFAEVRLLQFSKAFSPIDVTVFGISMVSNLVKSLKAPAPIFVISPPANTILSISAFLDAHGEELVS